MTTISNERLPVRYGPLEPKAWSCPTQGTDLPYVFVPNLVSPGRSTTVDGAVEPVWHDGANAEQDELLSGELRCTLTTMTPLLVANQQVVWSELSREKVAAIADVVPGGKVDAGKRVLFPLIHRSGAVLLPGEGLKGMVRHSLGALLGSPLERVNDGNFSLRPNAVVPAGRECETVPVPAMVEFVDESTLELRIRLIESLDCVGFVKIRQGEEAAHETLAPGCQIGDLVRRIGEGWTWRQTQGRAEWMRKGGAAPAPELPLRWLRYHFGLDSRLDFMKVAEKHSSGTLLHPSVLVPESRIEKEVISVSKSVFRQYLETRQHLGDAEHGHISRLPKRQDARFRPSLPTLTPHTLIFCEMQQGDGGQARIISFGHNFRYRWRHLDGIASRAIAFDTARGEWVFERRPELRAHPDEGPGPDGRPAKLTGTRALLGYVVDGHNTSFGGADPQLVERLLALKDPFDRMAGRISCNFAMERLKPGETTAERFVTGAHTPFVFLHPTLSPKPSSFRTYVPRQGRVGQPASSWGDGLLETPDAVVVQNGTQLFAGRKFFAHQGRWNAASGLLDLGRHHFDLVHLLNMNGATAHARDDIRKFILSDQASIACGVVNPGREFGWTVRFKDLRRHELAALLAVLEPGRLAESVRSVTQGMRVSRAAAPTGASFAVKLGHGRALGLGSVRIAVDRILYWSQRRGEKDKEPTRPEVEELLCKHLLPRLDDDVTAAWLGAMRVDREDERRPYLLHRNAAGQQESALSFNSEWRKQHLQASRHRGIPK